MAGTVFEQETGLSVHKAWDEIIAKPLGMEDYRPERQFYVNRYSDTRHLAYYFRVTARDLARFGQLFLNRGTWNGKQIIPGWWVDESTRKRSQVNNFGPDLNGFGYMWWQDTDGGYSARGYGGHAVKVIPEEDLVIVFRVDTDQGYFFNTGTMKTLTSRIVNARK